MQEHGRRRGHAERVDRPGDRDGGAHRLGRLAQIGEFSFILATLGVSLGLLPVSGQSLIVAGALISIALNPLVFAGVEPLRRWILDRSDLARKAEPAKIPMPNCR